MSYMSQSLRLSHASNLSVLNFRFFFCSCNRGHCRNAHMQAAIAAKWEQPRAYCNKYQIDICNNPFLCKRAVLVAVLMYCSQYHFVLEQLPSTVNISNTSRQRPPLSTPTPPRPSFTLKTCLVMHGAHTAAHHNM